MQYQPSYMGVNAKIVEYSKIKNFENQKLRFWQNSENTIDCICE